jgi:hypothetical protein
MRKAGTDHRDILRALSDPDFPPTIVGGQE